MTTKIKTKVFLADDDTFTAANNNLSIFGSTGLETVNILGYLPITYQILNGVEVDQNIEKVSFSLSSSDYLFLQAGNALKVFDSSGEVLIATIPVQEDGTDLSFGDGSESFTVTLSNAAVMKIGDVVIGSSAVSIAPVYVPDKTAPVVSLMQDTGISSTDKITRDPTLTINKSYYGFKLGNIKYSLNSTNGIDGDWINTSSYIQSNQFKQGINEVWVRRIIDNLGTVSDATKFTFTLDTEVPSEPTVSITKPITITNYGVFTRDGETTISGLEDGATVQYFVNGNWTDQKPAPTEGYNQFYIYQADVAGNQSGTSISFNYAPTLKAPTTKQEPWTLLEKRNGYYSDHLTISDGTTAGTKISPDIYYSSYTDFKTTSDETKAFLLQQSNSGSFDLVATNGVTTTIIKTNVNVDLSNQNNSLALDNGKIAFPLDNKTLLISDGTTTGTVESSVEILPSSLSSTIQDKAHGNYWFVANSTPYGQELGLLKINADGTATSRIVKDINPGSESGYYNFQGIALNSGKFIFAANPNNDYYNNSQLWVSDGTADGSVKINYEGNPNYYYSPYNFTALGDKAIFITNGKLGITDGTDANTHLISADTISNPTILKATADVVYFTGTNLVNGVSKTSLFSTDGSTAIKMSDISGSAQFLDATPNHGFFVVSDATSGQELWVADKATNSFHLAKDILTGSGAGLAGTYQRNVITVGDKIFFPAYVNSNSTAYFISDGTETGTIKISDDVPTSSYLIGNTLVFSNKTGVHSVDTSVATPIVSDLNSAANVILQHDADQVFFPTASNDFYVATAQSALKLASNVNQFKVMEENAIYFTETETINGNMFKSLWYSNATTEGTHFVSYVDNNFTLDSATVIHSANFPMFKVSGAESITEGDKVSFVINLTNRVTGDYSVRTTLTSLGGATTGTDFENALTLDTASVNAGIKFNSTTGILTIPASSPLTTATLTATTKSDNISPETGEGLSLILANPQGQNIAIGQATVNTSIIDIPPVTPNTPLFSIKASASSALEGNNATFTVNLSDKQTAATSVNLVLSSLAGSTTTIADYGSVSATGASLTDGVLTFAIGATTASITVPILSDNVSPETGEGITLSLTVASDSTVNVNPSAASANLKITNVPAPTISLQSDTGSSFTDKITNNPTLIINNSYESPTKIKYSLNSTNGVDGDWTESSSNAIYDNGQFKQGTNKIYAKQIYQSSNESVAVPFEFTLDTKSPIAPIISITHPIQTSNGVLFTRDGETTIFGLEDGATVQYIVNGNGTNQKPFPTEGNNQFYIYQADVAGNQSGTSISFNYAPTLKAPTTKQEPWTLITNSYDYYNGGYKLKVSDGTTNGTQSLGTGYNPVTNGDKTKVFFQSPDNSGKINLTATDGTVSGTSVIQNDIGYVNDLLKLNNGKIAFSLGDKGLLISDGTVSGTVISSIEVIPSLSSTIKDEANGNYWFVANTAPYGQELGLLKIKADGTATSGIVKDINPGSGSCLGKAIYDGNEWVYGFQGAFLNSGKFIFSASSTATDYNYNSDLWVSDGTETGTVKISYAVDQQSSYRSPFNFTAFGDKVFFTASNKLVVTDGTDVNTHFISLEDGGAVTNPSILKATADAVYFTGTNLVDNVFKTSLFSTDGSTAVKMSDISGSAQFLAATPNHGFFIVSDATSGQELWVADKATNSFHLVKDILTGSGAGLAGTNQGNVITIGDKILFPAYVNSNSTAYFISDGSEAGTIKISEDLPTSSYLIGSTLLFANKTGVHSVDTSAATLSVKDLNSTPNITLQHDADQVFFQTASNDLYVATAQSAVKLASNVNQFKVLEENAIYFTEIETINVNTFKSLWYSDATTDGTHFVSYVDNNFTLDGATVIHTVGV